MKQQDTVDYFLKVVWQNVSNTYNQIASGFGITQAIGYVLINIEAEGTAVSALAALLGVKATSLSRMLNNMEELGLIYRETASGDKRSVKVFLTPFGIEKRKLARNVVVSFNEYLNQHLNAKEKAQLIESLNKVNQLTLAYAQIDHDEQTTMVCKVKKINNKNHGSFLTSEKTWISQKKQ